MTWLCFYISPAYCVLQTQKWKQTIESLWQCSKSCHYCLLPLDRKHLLYICGGTDEKGEAIKPAEGGNEHNTSINNVLAICRKELLKRFELIRLFTLTAFVFTVEQRFHDSFPLCFCLCFDSLMDCWQAQWARRAPRARTQHQSLISVSPCRLTYITACSGNDSRVFFQAWKHEKEFKDEDLPIEALLSIPSQKTFLKPYQPLW